MAHIETVFDKKGRRLSKFSIRQTFVSAPFVLYIPYMSIVGKLQLQRVLFRDTTSYLTLCPKNTTRGSRKSSFFSSLDSGGPPTLPSFDLSFFANPSPPLSLMHRSDALSSPSKTSSSSSSVFPLLFLHAHQNPFFFLFLRLSFHPGASRIQK